MIEQIKPFTCSSYFHGIKIKQSCFPIRKMSEQEQTRLNKKQEDVVVIYHLRIKEGRLSGLMRWYAVSTFLSVSASTAIGRE